ncbi:multidrug resistance-associated ABC transporter [Gymnopilus junonius]|uniref:Multidrug resistance-associated ABC transporter n=1 Tax=Gymnopilus junonius TaxID=109634 RepID=A0A9P5NDU7_GYMJU|nr:multidrug resistance-associated ABC transporter [Gymnopilus junonius]
MKAPWHRWFCPPPAPPGFGSGKVLPESDASWISRLTIHWLSPFLNVGFSRPLEKEDLWDLPEARRTGILTDAVEKNYYARCPPEKRPFHMREGYERDSTSSDEKEQPEKDKEPNAQEGAKYDESLFKALLQTFKRRILGGGLLLLMGDTLNTTTPLLNKVLITWLTDRYLYSRLTDAERALAAEGGFAKPKGIGYGVGLSIALFVMQGMMSSIVSSMTTGLYVRTSVIGNVFRKSLRLSGKSRAEYNVGHITTLISTDTTRLDNVFYLGHYIWAAPIQLAIGIGLLIGNLGYSALVGLGVILLTLPLQSILVVSMLTQMKKGVEITDKRVRLTTEVLQGIRLIKMYGWEAFYLNRIVHLRSQEIKRLRKSSISLALLVAMFVFMPQLAAVLSFITYALTKHDLNVAVIFTSLQLFNILRAPLLLLPFALSGIAGSVVSFNRLCEFLNAEEIGEPYTIEPNQDLALKVDGDFEWENVAKLEEGEKTSNSPDKEDALQKESEKMKEQAEKKETQGQQPQQPQKPSSKWWKRRKEATEPENTLPFANPDGNEKTLPPFSLKEFHMDIPKGAFIAIVGRVGSGKSSVLQAMIGEMKRTKGEASCSVVFGGSVAYVPQSPWIKNATLRDNILFGQKDDDERRVSSKFHEVVQACSLEHDLEILPQGENTEIGEKGINLSGGQKARVSLARAAYSQAEIVLLDDPLSAVDSYVGKSILENCLLNGPLAKRTRVLVTHSLHVLDRTDYIYVMDQGKIIEQGSYSELMSHDAVFCRLIEEYGNTESQKQNQMALVDPSTRPGGGKEPSTDNVDAALMQAEERNTGAVTWDVYKKYLQSGGGLFWAPIIFILLLLVQANNVATTLFLGFWTENTIRGFKIGDYIGVYAGLGAAGAVLSYLQTYAFVFIGLFASLNLYKAALSGVLSSPTSFFDTTPMGRIISRLSKDQETIDQQLPLILMQFLTTFASVLGTVGLVFYTFPYLGILFAPLTLLYYVASVYYRRSSVEAKRLDSLLRSFLYGSYSETLTGLPTIRAYNRQDRSVKDAQAGLDMENKAYLMTVSMQRWLAVRLEFFANILVLGIALFGVGFSTSVNPSKISVVLTYTLSGKFVLAEMISFFAQSEQNMNAVERVLHYVELPPEKGKIELGDPPTSWPTHGKIVFNDVKFAYRESLPLVLKGVNFSVQGGEKIGIVGRTGSGKSSLIQALFRTAELQDGAIEIDDCDISRLDYHVLRTSIALVPQDTTLFLGTLRDNLDPQGMRTDAELISILQRAWLLPKVGPVDPVVEAKFSLDAVVGDEGSNYSAGEKQLLALCRALVKNSRIIVLDEATSSVDAETDSKVQQTIQDEFSSSTLLCIAHRLNTIAHYDRILVVDDGHVSEFDTVLNLFDRENSIFRSLCDEARLTRADILKLRQEHCHY